MASQFNDPGQVIYLGTVISVLQTITCVQKFMRDEIVTSQVGLPLLQLFVVSRVLLGYNVTPPPTLLPHL